MKQAVVAPPLARQLLATKKVKRGDIL